MKIFQWKDEYIVDIEQWAKERGEKMVDIIWKKKQINPYCLHSDGVITYVTENDTMPESFYNSLRITEDMGTPLKVTKREPKVFNLKGKLR